MTSSAVPGGDRTTLAPTIGLGLVGGLLLGLTPDNLHVYLIGAGILVLVAGVSLTRPMLLLYFIIATSCFAGLFRGFESLGVGGTALTVSGLRWVGVGAIAALMLAVNADKLSIPRVLAAFFFLPAWALCRLVIGPFTVAGAKDVLFYALPFLVGSYTIVAGRLGGGRWGVSGRMRTLILWSSVVPALLYVITIPLGLVEYTENGPKGVIGPRPVATYLLVVLTLALAEARYASSADSRRGAVWFAVAAVATIFFTASRMASASALVIIVLSRMDRIGVKQAILGSATLLMLAGTVFLTVPPIRDRMFNAPPTRPIELVTNLRLSGRDAMWGVTAASLLRDPLFGLGPGSARLVVGTYFQQRSTGSSKGNEVPPHNEYLQVTHDLGALGLLALLLAWIPLVMSTWRSWREASQPDAASWYMAATLGVLVVLLNAAVDNSFHYAPIIAPLFIMVGIALSAEQGRTPKEATEA